MTEIRHRISLEGGDEVLNKFRKIGDESESAGKRAKSAFEGNNLPTDAFAKFRQVSSKHFDDVGDHATEMAKKFRESLHILHAAGIEGLGPLSALARVAGAGGTALGAAGIGALLVGLERALDARTEQTAQIAALTGGPASGRGQFSRLQRTAEAVETPTSALAPAFQELLRISEGQRQAIAPDTLQKALQASFEGAQVSKLDPEKASGAITALFGSISDAGRLTPETANAAGKVMPALMEVLLKELNKANPGGDRGSGTFTGPQVVQALAKSLPELTERRRQTDSSIGTTIGEEWTKLRASLDRLTAAIGAMQLIASTLGGIRKGSDVVADVVTARNKRADEFKGSAGGSIAAGGSVGLTALLISAITGRKAEEQAGAHGAERTPDELEKLRAARGGASALPRGDTTESILAERDAPPLVPGGERQEAPGVESLRKIATVSDEASASVGGLSISAKNATQTLQDLTKRSPEQQLGRIGAGLSTKQAELEYRFKPEENRIRLGLDKLDVERAALNVQSSKLAEKEAQKNIELAKFAQPSANIAVGEAEKGYALAKLHPGDARLAVSQAGQSVEQASYSLQALTSGRDPEQERQLAISGAENSLRAAQRAEQKARIEQRYARLVPQAAKIDLDTKKVEAKYAYLKPQEAEVAGKKAEADIRGQQFLQQSSELTLAKDKEGMPIATDVAALRYAQAQLDEIKKLQEFGQGTVNTLEQILAAIKELKGGKGGGDAEEAHAEGGMIRGPGTGTSDSIYARLSSGGGVAVSDGEFVVNAKDTAKHLPLLHAINAGKLAGKFASGGFVSAFGNGLLGRANAFGGSFLAGGLHLGGAFAGLSLAGLHPVTLNMPGGQQVTGFYAQPSAIHQLTVAAPIALAQRTGPRPSWYRG